MTQSGDGGQTVDDVVDGAHAGVDSMRMLLRDVVGVQFVAFVTAEFPDGQEMSPHELD